MRSISRISLVMAASAALVGSIALPASAAEDRTETTVNVTAGGLSISAPETAALLDVAPGAKSTATLPDVKVTDLRAGILGWVAAVSLGDFVGTDPTNTFTADAATYTPGAADVNGTATVAETPAADLTSLKAVQTATAVKGNNTATWTAELSVNAPTDALADRKSVV